MHDNRLCQRRDIEAKWPQSLSSCRRGQSTPNLRIAWTPASPLSPDFQGPEYFPNTRTLCAALGNWQSDMHGLSAARGGIRALPTNISRKIAPWRADQRKNLRC